MIILASLGMVMAAIYSLGMMQRTFFGRQQDTRTAPDLSNVAFGTLLFIAGLQIWLGLYPKAVLTTTKPVMEHAGTACNGICQSDSLAIRIPAVVPHRDLAGEYPMILQDFIALSPILDLGAFSLVTMLAIAFRRNHARIAVFAFMSCLLTLATSALGGNGDATSRDNLAGRGWTCLVVYGTRIECDDGHHCTVVPIFELSSFMSRKGWRNTIYSSCWPLSGDWS